MTTPTGISLSDALDLLRQKWRTVLLAGSLGFAVAVVYALLAPKWYEARLSLVSSKAPKHGLADITSGLPDIPGLSSSFANDSRRIEAVLTSNSVTDEVIGKFDLMSRYGVEHIEHAREAVWRHCSTKVDRKSRIVALRCEDQDPERAREIVAYFGEVGNRVFGRISTSSAGEERRFLEKQVTEALHKVDESSRKLRDFRVKNRVIDLTEQSKAVISAMASMNGELISKELELSYLSSFSSQTETGVVQLKQQIAILEQKLSQLERSRPGKEAAPPATPPTPPAGGAPDEDADFFPDAMDVPSIRFELEELYREQKIREAVYALLTRRYEMSKVDEARDTSTFQILDHPTTPTIRSRPKRRKIAAVGLFCGTALAGVWILIPVWWRRRFPGRLKSKGEGVGDSQA